jgi:hypothetical protein
MLKARRKEESQAIIMKEGGEKMLVAGNKEVGLNNWKQGGREEGREEKNGSCWEEGRGG